MPGNKYSGRKCDWFIERCADIISDEKLVEFVGRVAAGRETEEKIFCTKDGAIVRDRVAADINARLSAFKMLAEWAFGKPIPAVPARTPEDSKRTADEYFQSLKRLEEDALNRFRESAEHR